MSVDNEEDLRGLRRAGSVVARTLDLMKREVRVGITTQELDRMADAFIASEGARPAPRMVYGFPGAISISLNDEAVHGIPGERKVREGDLITFDVTVELDGYFADAAITMPIGRAKPIAEKLCACAESAFWKGCEVARSGELLANLGGAVEAEVVRHGFRVLRDLAGHGIGRTIHEEPSVANFRVPGEQGRLTNGLVIALEPIISRSATRSRMLRDGWTFVSADRSLTAHFEHTIVITDNAPIILTAA